LSGQYEPTLATRFEKLISDEETQKEFLQLMDKFPEHLRYVGKLEPDEEKDRIITQDHLGTVWAMRPSLFGDLYSIINDGTREIYVYSNVYYHRLRDHQSGRMHVAIDPESNEWAAVLRTGSDLSGYNIAGSSSLRPVLLAFTAASDVDFFNMLAHYQEGKKNDYVSPPIALPLSASNQAIVERLHVLNEQLGEGDAATVVAEPKNYTVAKAAASERAWYGVTHERDRCIESPLSPAQRIGLIKEAGITPIVRDSHLDGKLNVVEVTADDGRFETTWRFFKKKEDCERTLSAATSTPDRYR
jgi:hypothetical protein